MYVTKRIQLGSLLAASTSTATKRNWRSGREAKEASEASMALGDEDPEEEKSFLRLLSSSGCACRSICSPIFGDLS